VGPITLPAIAKVIHLYRDKKVLEISGVAQRGETTAEARIRKAGQFRSDFATVRLRHYTAAFLPLIEGAYV